MLGITREQCVPRVVPAFSSTTHSFIINLNIALALSQPHFTERISNNNFSTPSVHYRNSFYVQYRFRYLKIVKFYTFLCSIVTRYGMCKKEIKRRIMMGKSKLERILKDKNVTKQTKIKIAETLVFPIVAYGSESWTMR